MAIVSGLGHSRDSASIREKQELRFDGGMFGRECCWLARARMAVAEWCEACDRHGAKIDCAARLKRPDLNAEGTQRGRRGHEGGSMRAPQALAKIESRAERGLCWGSRRL